MRRPGAWLESLTDLCSSLLENEGEPITLLLGAGASLSSGTPSTGQVVAGIREAYPHTFDSDEAVYEKLVIIGDREKRTRIERLFREVQPYVGYQMLAAIARSRPITVVNLNWDDCVRRACDLLGVKSWDRGLGEPIHKIRADLAKRDKQGAGIVCIHVHGRLRREGERDPPHPLRFATLETLGIEHEDQIELLKECFDAKTLVAGTSLSAGREQDTHQLIEALLGSGDGTDNPLWFARREEEHLTPAKTIEAVVHARGGGRTDDLRGPDLNFDRLMWTLRAADAGYSWDDGIVEDIRRNGRQIALPDEKALILTKPDLLRPLLAEPQPVVVLPGRARQGKSTAAHMLAHWLALVRPDPPRVQTFRRGSCADALAEIEPGAVVVLDEPFGESEYRPVPELYDALLKLRQGSGNVIVATRHESFACAAREAEEELPSTSSDPGDWWDRMTLGHYAEQLKPGAGDRVAADPTLNTPLKVKRAVRTTEGEQVRPDDPAESISWLRAELERGSDLAALRVIVRLQDFYGPVRADNLYAAVGYDPGAHPASALGGMLKTVPVDHEYLRLGSQEDVDAVDGVLAEHRELVMKAALEPVATKLPWVLDSLDAWDAVIGDAGSNSPDDIDVRVLTEWTFELTRRAAARSIDDAWALLERARECSPDSWAMREVVFAAASQWRTIQGHDQARVFLQKVLDDRPRRGTYALLEALLRFNASPPIDLVAHLVISIYDLARENAAPEELVLIFDGLLWKSLPVGDHTREELFRLLLDAAKQSAGMRAAFAAVAAYHRDGAKFLIDRPALGDPLRWASRAEDDPTLVTWLIQWHVAHQARTHAVMTRESFRAADSQELQMLQRTLCHKELLPDQVIALGELTKGLQSSPEHAGAGVLLAANVNNTTGAFDTQDLADRVGEIRKNDTDLALCAFYEAPDALKLPLQDYLERHGRTELLETLGCGFKFETVDIAAPRFLLMSDGWDVRGWWSISDGGLGKRLGLSLDDPSAFVQALGEHHDEALDSGADELGLKRVMTRAERGDTTPIERVMARGRRGGRGPDDPSAIASALTEASRTLAEDESP
jgi:hypothetical protein